MFLPAKNFFGKNILTDISGRGSSSLLRGVFPSTKMRGFGSSVIPMSTVVSPHIKYYNVHIKYYINEVQIKTNG